ncbi:ComEC/Rec2 family competence protein [Gorillibacterium sp. CAU 1737]|uniref:ComEC/Rec2 family competence protein n=1 Tax=Gorillibacterium sp. CAU 1737 TaxID=3140362 RepID=UPI00326115D2
MKISPLVKGTLALLAGYSAAARFGPAPSAGLMLGVSLLLIAGWGGIQLVSRKRLPAQGHALRHGRSPIQSMLPILLMVMVSFLYYSWFDSANQSDLQEKTAASLDGATIEATGTLLTPVEVDGDRASFYLKGTSASVQGAPEVEVEEKLRVTVRLLREEEQAVAAAWRRGDRVHLTGTLRKPEPARNYGGFDYRSYLRRQHIHYLLSVKGTDGIVQSGKEAGWLSLLPIQRAVDELREKLSGSIEAVFPEDQAGYMNGLILGITDGIEPDQYEQFSELGLTHLLAISGLHVAVFVAAFLGLFRLLRLPRETAQLIVMVLLPFYVLLTGAAPSIMRAGLMAMLALYAARKNRLKDGLHLVSLTALLMLLVHPYYLMDVGFQLSFLVTAGLILGVPSFSRLLPVKNPLLNGTLSVTLVAQLASFPLTVYYFNQVSFLSLPANLLLVSIVSYVVTPGGTLAMLAVLVYPAAGEWIAWPVALVNRASFRLVSWMNQGAHVRLIWPSPPVGWILFYYAACALLLAALAREQAARRRRKAGIRLPERFGSGRGRTGFPLSRVRNASAALFVLALGCGGILPGGERAQAATVSFLDIGQGDSILVTTPAGRHLLIDGGGALTIKRAGEEWKQRRDPYEVGKKTLVPLLKKRGIGILDAVFVTHLDEDHIGGLMAVVEQLTVRKLVFNGTLKNSPMAERLFRTAEERGIPLYQAGEGSRYRPDDDTELVFLGPPAPTGELKLAAEQNEVSLVFLLKLYNRTFLFTGDMGQITERELIANRNVLPTGGYPIDVLKVAHHGSKHSTGIGWLSYWQPRFAVISVGKSNLYGHPSADTLTRLNEAEASVLRTDERGEVRFRVTREALHVETRLP